MSEPKRLVQIFSSGPDFWRLSTLVHGTSIAFHLELLYAVEILLRCSGVNHHIRRSGVALLGLSAV